MLEWITDLGKFQVCILSILIVIIVYIIAITIEIFLNYRLEKLESQIELKKLDKIFNGKCREKVIDADEEMRGYCEQTEEKP